MVKEMQISNIRLIILLFLICTFYSCLSVKKIEGVYSSRFQIGGSYKLVYLYVELKNDTTFIVNGNYNERKFNEELWNVVKNENSYFKFKSPNYSGSLKLYRKNNQVYLEIIAPDSIKLNKEKNKVKYRNGKRKLYYEEVVNQ